MKQQTTRLKYAGGLCFVEHHIMEKIQQERTHEQSSSWRPPLHIAVTAGLIGLGAFAWWHQESTVSGNEAQDAIYEKYGECLATTPYTLGQVAVEYVDEVARVTPTDMPEQVLVFDMPLGISGRPLPRPDEATEVLLADIGCEAPEPFWRG